MNPHPDPRYLFSLYDRYPARVRSPIHGIEKDDNRWIETLDNPGVLFRRNTRIDGMAHMIFDRIEKNRTDAVIAPHPVAYPDKHDPAGITAKPGGKYRFEICREEIVRDCFILLSSGIRFVQYTGGYLTPGPGTAR